MQQVESGLEAGGDGFEGAGGVEDTGVGGHFGWETAGGFGEAALLQRDGGEQRFGLGDDGRLVAADAAQFLRIGLEACGLRLPGAEAIVDGGEGGESLPLVSNFIAEGATALRGFQHFCAPLFLFWSGQLGPCRNGPH